MMTVFEVVANDYWCENTEYIGLFSSKKKAYKALFDNGYAIRDFEGRPTWRTVDDYQYPMLARIYERVVM